MKLNKTKIPIILDLVNQGKSREYIADVLGVSNKNLRDYCYRYEINIPTLYTDRIKKRTDLILDCTQRGYSREEIAAELGIGVFDLQAWAYRNQVPIPIRTTTIDCKNTGNIIIKASVPKYLAEELMKEAKTRKVGVKNLTASLLACIAEGKLYNAVLDQ